MATKVESDAKDEEECEICMVPFGSHASTRLPCGHRYHTTCIGTWARVRHRYARRGGTPPHLCPRRCTAADTAAAAAAVTAAAAMAMAMVAPAAVAERDAST